MRWPQGRPQAAVRFGRSVVLEKYLRASYRVGDTYSMRISQVTAWARDEWRRLFEDDSAEAGSAYWMKLSREGRERFLELADLCVLGRETFYEATAGGFLVTPGSEAADLSTAVSRPDWPGGPWPTGADSLLHQVGLMISLSASGHLGEMSGLLRGAEVVYSLPVLSRAVVENCARLFRIYQLPYVLMTPGGAATPAAMKQTFAAADLEILTAAFAARTLAAETLKLDPGDADLARRLRHAEDELTRLQGAYGPLFNPATSDVTSKKTLRLEGLRPYVMTELVDDLIAWLWPDASTRPSPQYRVLSGLAHSSLDAQLALFNVDDSTGTRHLLRSIPLGHVEYLVLVAALVYQRLFARLTGFYDWPVAPLDRFSEGLATTFPGKFTYGD